MRKTLLVLAIGAAMALAAFVYQQAVVEGAFGPAALFGTALLLVVFLVLFGMYALSGTRHRELVAKVLLAGAATGVSYLAMDILVGMILIQPLSPQLVADQYRHHVLVPNAFAEFRQQEFTYVQRVNNLGMRGEDVTLEKPPGTRRILMLGDSYTMGKGVQDNETFSVLVEDMLQPQLAACGAGPVEVLNGGVDSYAPILSLIQLRRDLTPLAPDLVILNLDVSDLIQEAAYRQQAVFDPKGEIVGVPQTAQPSMYERTRSWVERNLFFTRVVLVYVNRLFDHGELTVRRVVNERARDHLAHTLAGDVDRSAQWDDLFDSVARIKAHTDSLGIEFMMTTYPWAHQLADSIVAGEFVHLRPGDQNTDLSAQTIRAHAEQLGIDLYELFPRFKAYDGGEALYFRLDGHWTAAGQRVAAEGIMEHLLQHHVPGWCAGA